ncbi:MAG: hypothetical protein DDT20_01428 [Firmicutes bacterium]|nr:hypothetical protein [Bacillota bacterium]
MIIPAVRLAGATATQEQSNLQLEPGTIYRATVLRQESTTVLLRMAGVLLRGESELTFLPGQVIHLRPEPSLDQHIVLRMVTTPSIPQGTDLGPALRQLGLSTNPRLQLIAKALFGWMVPLHPDAMRKILADTTTFSPEKLAAYLNALGWGNSVGIDYEGAIARLVASFLPGEAAAEEVPLALRQINDAAASPLYPDVKVVWWESEAHHGELYVMRDDVAGQLPSEDIQVAVRVQTMHYGELWLAFSYRAGQIDLVCHANAPELLQHIEDGRATIAAAIKAGGATFGNLRCHAGLVLSVLDVFPPAPLAGYTAVDLKV